MWSFRGRYWWAVGALTAACGGGANDTSATGGEASHLPCAECAQAGGGGSSGAGGAGGTSGGAAVEAGAPEAGALDAAGGVAGTDDAAGAAGEGGSPPLIDDGVALSEVSFWQAMRVPLELAGSPVPPNAPIILNKAGILRVYVSPGTLFHARQLSALLELGPGSGAAPFRSTKLIRAASADADFASTFNFPIDALHVVANASYSVVLQDGAGGPELARYPARGTSSLAPVSAGKTLNVVVVPLVVAGIVPDVSPTALSIYRARLLSMYPLADVSISARDPVVSNVSVGPDLGWDQLLDALYALRAEDGPADNVFYFGLFTPTRRFDDYCVTDCLVGLSSVAGPDEVESRGSIGLGIFSDGSNSDAPDTMAHELGHALGRRHAPCGGASSPDKLYPDPGGRIGVWGFDSLNHLLLDPSVSGDVMGYCSPDWISDYTYSAIFGRIQHVNAGVTGALALRLEVAASVVRRVLVGAQGELHWGSRFVPSHGPQGEAQQVILLGPDGTEIGSAAGYFQPFSDAPGGFLSVPEGALDAGAGIAAIRVGTAELSLSAPMP